MFSNSNQFQPVDCPTGQATRLPPEAGVVIGSAAEIKVGQTGITNG
jgi:hypothetical protein